MLAHVGKPKFGSRVFAFRSKSAIRSAGGYQGTRLCEAELG